MQNQATQCLLNRCYKNLILEQVNLKEEKTKWFFPGIIYSFYQNTSMFLLKQSSSLKYGPPNTDTVFEIQYLQIFSPLL